MRYIILLFLFIAFNAKAQLGGSTGGGYTVSSGGDSSCYIVGTRGAIIALRNANSLNIGCQYIINDHIQNRLVAGTTITLTPTSVNEFSENVEVNTTYDNEAWRGVYDIDRGLVLELQDNRNNVARGFNGNEVGAFDWGNTFITNVLVDNSTWNTTYGASRTVTNCEIKEGSTLTTTSQTGGTIRRLNLYGASQLNTTSSSINLTSVNLYNGSNFALSNFTGGSTLTNWTAYGSTLNINGSSSGISLSTVYLYNSVINHTNVTTGTLTGSSLIMENSSTINHNAGALNLSLNRVKISNNSSVNHTSGAISLSDYFIESASQVNQSTGTTGNISLGTGRLSGGSTVQNLSDYNINGTRFSAYEISSLVVNNGALGTGTFTSTNLYNQSSITIGATSTAGNTSVTSCILSSGATIAKSNTGALTLSNSELNSQGRIIFNSVRNLTATRDVLSNLGTLNLTATAGAGVTDQVSDVVMDTRSNITMSASGAASNSILYTSCDGLSANITIGGTSTGQSMQRIICNNSTINMNNNTVGITLDLSVAEMQGNITIQNMTVAKGINYLSAKNNSTININNPTGAGSHSFIYAENGGAITIQGTATVSQYLYARNQGAINHNGGQTTNMIKDMVGTITTGAFNHSNCVMISPTSITLTAANTTRATYLGVTSTVPLF